jgi:hypothetical protein
MAGRSLRLVLEKRLAPIPEPSAACLFLHAKKLAHAVSSSRIARNVTARNSTRRPPFHGFAFFQTTFRNRAMKLAEALMQRADMQKRPDQLKKPLRRNAQVQEDDAPASEPAGPSARTRTDG